MRATALAFASLLFLAGCGGKSPRPETLAIPGSEAPQAMVAKLVLAEPVTLRQIGAWQRTEVYPLGESKSIHGSPLLGTKKESWESGWRLRFVGSEGVAISDVELSRKGDQPILWKARAPQPEKEFLAQFEAPERTPLEVELDAQAAEALRAHDTVKQACGGAVESVAVLERPALKSSRELLPSIKARQWQEASGRGERRQSRFYEVKGPSGAAVRVRVLFTSTPSRPAWHLGPGSVAVIKEGEKVRFLESFPPLVALPVGS